MGSNKRRGAVTSHPVSLASREASSVGSQAGTEAAPEDQAWFNAAFTSSTMTSFSSTASALPGTGQASSKHSPLVLCQGAAIVTYSCTSGAMLKTACCI